MMNDNGSSFSKCVGKVVMVIDIVCVIGVLWVIVLLVLCGSLLVNVDIWVKVEVELCCQCYVYNCVVVNLCWCILLSIVLVINDFFNLFFVEFVLGVDEVLGGCGYVILFGSMGELLEWQQVVLFMLMEYILVGLILLLVEGSDIVQLWQVLGVNVNVLLFNCELVGVDWDFLILDNQYGVYLVMCYLIECGYCQIVFFGGYVVFSFCYQCCVGFQQVLVEVGLLLLLGWMVELVLNWLEVVVCIDELFVDGYCLSVVVCYNDIVVLGLMLGLNLCGICLGGDFVVIGFDDIFEVLVVVLLLIMFIVDLCECGCQVVVLLLQWLDEFDVLFWCMVVLVQLCICESSVV